MPRAARPSSPRPTLRSLPEFVEPMLASTASEAFDSPDHLFELKWDGFRALCFADGRRTCRLVGRRRTAFNSLFPELDALRALPAGTAIDGEIVLLDDEGKPDFSGLLRRQRRGGTRRANERAATFVAFDLLYERFDSIMARPCEERRRRLRELLHRADLPCLEFSQATLERGKDLFAEVNARGLEGIVAKRRDRPYLPGMRTSDWIKIKRRHELLCVVVGYEPSRERGLKSLILASEIDGRLTCVGQVGSGISAALHADLLRRLTRTRRPTPVVACDGEPRSAVWVEPELFCAVSYAERTRDGKLRAPVFERLVEPTRS